MTTNAHLDAVQEALAGPLNAAGFSPRGRTFTSALSGGLVHAVNIQAGMKSQLGRFTLNLGVFLPECHRFFRGGTVGAVQEVECEIRARIGSLFRHPEGGWWQHTPPSTAATAEALSALSSYGLPFLRALSSREAVLEAWRIGRLGPFLNPRQDIAMSLVLAELGARAEALSRLKSVSATTTNRHLRSMAARAEAYLTAAGDGA